MGVRREWWQVHDQMLGLYMIAYYLDLLPLNGRLSTRDLIDDTAWLVEYKKVLQKYYKSPHMVIISPLCGGSCQVVEDGGTRRCSMR